jgi:hypothetical protein
MHGASYSEVLLQGRRRFGDSFVARSRGFNRTGDGFAAEM